MGMVNGCLGLPLEGIRNHIGCMGDGSLGIHLEVLIGSNREDYD